MQRNIENLKTRGSNATCYSCEQPSNWASVSLGLFLCITHAGKHRGYGTHISTVRSIDLDSWTPKQVCFMRKGGNDRAREFFEKHFYGNPDQIWTSPAADEYRHLLKQEVYDEIGVDLEEEKQADKPIELDPELRKFRNATAFGSADLNPHKQQQQRQEQSCWSCCTIL
eukprot:TRINITY_DN3376_c0_g1_i2.p1 TRINITY_DN3376_c0_g1~~TRINITY_DN3376_c0_g1_i2.p1  ORF type:complete len:169 (+),score=31.64 TRINITY_DN3376_c0_g1_i2:102-608(+)